MLRFVNFSRNVGGNLVRSSLREDRPKAGATPQFLFWFNETPGFYTPIANSNPLSALSSQQPSHVPSDQSWSRCCPTELSKFAGFSGHQEDDHKFQATQALTILRALQYGAILAVGYNIFHDKNLARAIYETSSRIQDCQNLEVPLDFLKSHCPVLAVKHHKTALAQPLENKVNKVQNEIKEDLFARLSVPDVIEKYHDSFKELSSTSDYSSHKSDSRRTVIKFSNEEQSFLDLQDSLPQAVDALLAVQLVKNGDKDGIEQLRESSLLGCSISQFYLGQAYEQGMIVKKDMEKAAKYYKEAANGGHPEAKYNLGVFFLRGVGGCEISEEIGLKLVQEAAEGGISEAITALSNNEEKEEFFGDNSIDISEIEQLYTMGIVLEENELNDSDDLVFALELYRVAAQNGHKLAEKKFISLSEKMSKETASYSVNC